MRIATKRLLMKIATAAAVACTAAIVMLPGTASAATTAYTTANLTIRERPTTSSDRVGSLSVGQRVTVEGCRQSWCYISSPQRGFISAGYVSTSPSSRVMISPNFNLSFNFPTGSFSIGNGGVSIGIGPPGDDDEDEDFAQACFYSGTNYTGSRLCVDEGDSYSRLSSWNDRISSILNPDGLRVTVCIDNNYNNCRTYSTSARTLGNFDNEISSLRVR